MSNLLETRANTELEARLDNHQYDESTLLEIRVPLNMPYQAANTSFERFDGEIEVNGVHFHYVERKIDAGELVLKCIPNQKKQDIRDARDAFFKRVNDLDNNNAARKSGHQAVVKSVIGDYETTISINLPVAPVAQCAVWNLYAKKAGGVDIAGSLFQPPRA